jgi:membrane protease subunit (stomatin/prohibitin family)
MKKQSSLFRGIYEFEDDTGSILAAKVPFQGSADLYDDTAVNVRPNQRAMFIYKGKIVDILKPGIHNLSTENVPILTRLASWKWGGRSPLRAEIWFFSGNKHLGKKFGTPKPILSKFDGVGVIPIRSFGSYNVRLVSPKRFYNAIIGSKNSFNILELEDFVQNQLVELLPEALDEINDIQSLSKDQDKVSQKLEQLAKPIFKKYGFAVSDIQIKSLLPSKEIVEALESKVAMSLVGDPRKYMLYKAANGLEAMEASGEGDPTQMMLAMMLGRGMNMVDAPEQNQPVLPDKTKSSGGKFCVHCGAAVQRSYKFCAQCGGKQ